MDEGAAALLTDHSGAAGHRMALAGELRLHDGTAALAPATAAHLSVVASHPDGRRLERHVPQDAGDDLLRELLADGWHIEEARR